jgi:hypothetical protein
MWWMRFTVAMVKMVRGSGLWVLGSGFKVHSPPAVSAGSEALEFTTILNPEPLNLYHLKLSLDILPQSLLSAFYNIHI